MASRGEKTPLLQTASTRPRGAGHLSSRSPLKDYDTPEEVFRGFMSTPFMEEPQEVSDISTTLSSAGSGSLEGRPPQHKPLTEDQLMFHLRYANMSPGVNWFKEVQRTVQSLDEPGVYVRVLEHLREFPMPLKDKLSLRNLLERESMKISGQDFDPTQQGGNEESSPGHGQRKKIGNRYHMTEVLVPFGLWEQRIATVAAYFGTNVASYFQFLRFLILLNFWTGLLLFFLVSLPQIISGETKTDDVMDGFFSELSESLFFYGAHSNTTLGQFDRPLSYFLSWCAVNILTALIIVLSMYISYRRIKTTDEEGEGPYSNLALLGWDHSVTSNEGAKIRALTITTRFKEMERDDSTRQKPSALQRLKLLTIRILFNLICLAVLAGSGVLIYFIADSSISVGDGGPAVVNDFLDKYALTAVVLLLKIIIPPVLTALLALEKYRPRTRIKMEVARTACFYAASVCVFTSSVFSVASKCMSKNHGNSTQGTNNETLNLMELDVVDDSYCCWEVEVGEEVFKVIILDLILNILVSVLFTGGKAVLVKTERIRGLKYRDFNVAAFILDLVYGQSLIWLGLYFAPFLAMVGVVKLSVMFYFHFLLAKMCCSPPRKLFRASRSGTFYLFVLLASLCVCLVPMTYSLLEIEPSQSCGPFKQNLRAYHVLTDKIGDSPYWFQDGIGYISTPGLLIPLVFGLLLTVFFYHGKSSAQRQQAKDLRLLLQFERTVEKRRVLATAQRARDMPQASGVRRQTIKSPRMSISSTK